MDRRTPHLLFKPVLAWCTPLIAGIAIVAMLSILTGLAPGASAETLGSCKVCREYNRVCLQAHSKQACESELEMCLKHCSRKK